jgi:tRNA A-37 threonylcarbamoyl transferase component Bud32/tetratricopeptide (TPR) repeat protein
MTDSQETPPDGLSREEMLPTEELPRPDVSPATGPKPDSRTDEREASSRGKRTFQNGQLIGGRYRILRFIAAGGRGEVYEALDTELDERVAVKCIRQQAAQDPKAALRLKREILLARRITHPNVCRLFDVEYHTPGDSVGPMLFLTMELLNGETLVQLMERRGPLSPEEALPIVEQLCDGLHAAHEAGVIHRDFKSDNVILMPLAGGAKRAVIMDFGLARADSETDFATLTATGKVVGTPAYMAPEQIQGDVVDRRADLYALGVVMFEMMTGTLPFIGESPLSTAVKRLKRAPPSPRDRLPDVDPLWERVILRCLARDPGRRFGTAAEVKDALLGEGSAGDGRLWRRTVGNTGVWVRGLIAAAALIFLFGVGYQLVVSKQITAPAATAPTESPPAVVMARRPAIGVVELRNVADPDIVDWRGVVVSRLIQEGLSHVPAVRSPPYDTLWWRAREAGIDAVQLLDPATVQAKAPSLGVDYLVTGSYLVLDTPPSPSLRLDLRLVRSADGESVMRSGQVGSIDALPALVDRVILELVERLHPGGDVGIWSLRHEFADATPEGLRAFYAGRDALRMGDLAPAGRELDDAARLMTDQPAVQSVRGQLLSLQGRSEEARQAFKRAWMDSAGQPAEIRLEREADFRRSAGDWARLAEIDTALAGLYPDELGYGLDLAQAQLRMHRAAAAQATVASLRQRFVDVTSTVRLDLFESRSAALRPSVDDRVRLARRAVQRAAELQDRRLETWGRLAWARALGEAGKPGRGVAVLRSAGAAMHELGDVALEAEVLCESAALQLQSGESGQATQIARQARELASSHDLLMLEARAAKVLRQARAHSG